MTTKAELDTKLQLLFREIRQRIERAPISSFLVGIVIGAVITAFSNVLVPLILIVALVVAALLWFLSDEQDPSSGLE